MESAIEHIEIRDNLAAFWEDHEGEDYLNWDLNKLILCVNELGGEPTFKSDMWVGIKTTGNLEYIEYSDEDIAKMPDDNEQCEKEFPDFKYSFDIWVEANDFLTAMKKTLHQLIKLYEKYEINHSWASGVKEKNETRI